MAVVSSLLDTEEAEKQEFVVGQQQQKITRWGVRKAYLFILAMSVLQLVIFWGSKKNVVVIYYSSS